MKIAFTGKGGCGKTTLASILIRIMSETGRRVLAVDCDPDSNLGMALGMPDIDKITPIIEMEELIKERMGITDDNRTFFKLNPKIDDIPDRFSTKRENIILIVMGSVKRGGSGCVCPENAFVKNLLEHLVLKRDEDVIMDMEAGVEHFGRGTAQSCDCILVVIEPSQKSIESAHKISSLANDIGIKDIFVLANKLRQNDDKEFIKSKLRKELRLIGSFPFDETIIDTDKTGKFEDINKNFIQQMRDIYIFLTKHIGEG